MNRNKFLKSTAFLAFILKDMASCQSDWRNSTITTLDIDNENTILSELDLINFLKKSTLGFSIEDVNELKNKNLNLVIKQLIDDARELNYPINYEFSEDKLVKIGDTWINAPYRTDVFYERYRNKSLRAWFIYEIFKNRCSLKNNMMLFWVNYFSISGVLEHKYEYHHVKYLYNNCFGNLRNILYDITIDPAMLVFLNGNNNLNNSPNENYARELLELYTLGKGEIASKGDYNSYTEQDVREIAKSLTGWNDTGWFTEVIENEIGSEFISENHNQKTKTLSPRLNNVKIKNNDAEEYKRIIDILVDNPATALYFCKKIYRWFCSEEINEETEKNIILPLAKIFKENDFEIKPLIEALFKNKFYLNQVTQFPDIKTPMSYIFNILHFFPLTISNSPISNFKFCNEIFTMLGEMGMEVFQAPSVAGWKAFYQEPFLSKLWINSATLKKRKKFIDLITISGIHISQNEIVKIDYQKFITNHNLKSIKHFIEILNLHLLSMRLPEDLYKLEDILEPIREVENFSNETSILEKNMETVLNRILNNLIYNIN